MKLRGEFFKSYKNPINKLINQLINIITQKWSGTKIPADFL